MAKKKTPVMLRPAGARSDKNPSLRAESFVVELLLERGKARSTHLLHVPSSREARWDGWKESRLLEFLRECAGLPKPAPPRKKTVAPAAASPAPEAPRVPMDLTIRQAGLPDHRVGKGQPLALELDLHAEGRARSAAYVARFLARRCDDGTRVQLADYAGMLNAPDGRVRIEVSAASAQRLRPGLYFVSASVESPSGGKGDSMNAGLLELV